VFSYIVRKAQLSAAIRENVKDAGIRVFADTRELVGRTSDADWLRMGSWPKPTTSSSFGLRKSSRSFCRQGRFDVRGRVPNAGPSIGKKPCADTTGDHRRPLRPDKHKPDTVEASAELKGLAVSPGIVTGPARVILLAGTEQSCPGEILVAPFTDPGWTPYFIPAAGIVMDQGGLLSPAALLRANMASRSRERRPGHQAHQDRADGSG